MKFYPLVDSYPLTSHSIRLIGFLGGCQANGGFVGSDLSGRRGAVQATLSMSKHLPAQPLSAA